MKGKLRSTPFTSGRKIAGQGFNFEASSASLFSCQRPQPSNRQRLKTSICTGPQFSPGARRKSRSGHCHADVRLSNPHVANHAAALAVHALAPEMTYAQVFLLAEKATNWAAQAYHKWFWRGIPRTRY